MKTQLISLYNGIMNDYSIRRYSLGWEEIINKIEKKYKNIPKTNEQFENKLIYNALDVVKGSLYRDIECFGKELSINLETLREKPINIGTQRSPFGIGS
jgi:hypothetical protein